MRYCSPPLNVLCAEAALAKVVTFAATCQRSFITFFDWTDAFSRRKPDFSIVDFKSRQSLLHVAVQYEDLGALRSLLRFSLGLACQADISNHTPLSLAIQQRRYQSAKVLLAERVNPNLGGGSSGTCLVLAILDCQPNLVHDLLKGGADPNGCCRESRRTPFHFLF